jgi:GntR family transcriptional regulator of arabinose operon
VDRTILRPYVFASTFINFDKRFFMSTALNAPESTAVPIEQAVGADDGGHGPKYEQLRQQIIDQIASGKLKPGEALPTERWWAEQHKLARSTVRQAMSSLERDGLIRRLQGKGTFVHEQALERYTDQGRERYGDQARETFSHGLAAFALVLPETQAGFYPSLQRSFDKAASAVHHQLLVCNTGNNVDRQGNIILQLLDKQVAGVALVPVTLPPTPAYQVRQLQKAGIPVVCCHRRVESVNAPLLAIPFLEIGLLVGRELGERGHRRVAFFAPHRTASSEAYESGLRTGLAESRGVVPEGCMFYGVDGLVNPSDYEADIAAALESMLNRQDRPTAIFASFDSLAELIYLLLERFGLRVPDDISIVGLGGISRSTPMMRRLTSATIDEVQIGQMAAELLEKMGRGLLQIDSSETHVVPIGLSDGQTLGPVPVNALAPRSPAVQPK